MNDVKYTVIYHIISVRWLGNDEQWNDTYIRLVIEGNIHQAVHYLIDNGQCEVLQTEDDKEKTG